ncbi:unknown [Firmicutes bacterium CAG:460]|nr:unknown [Firmicutes bacterium CAG:460]
MKIKVKHVLLFIIVSITIMSFTIYNIVINNDVYEEVDSRNIINNKLISLMIEETRGSGVYKVSKDNKWPSKKYIFNETLSNCKNGSTLTWNKNDNSVTVNVNKTDKCEVYFDVEPADITIKPLNLPTTYGKLGSINCTNSDATYNQKYNRIEVSNINTKYENCTLNYTDSTSKVNLADYIIGLAGTTQGTGKVVNEKGYRYEGKNPNNYIWFNNEYWRIIGVFDSASHGLDGKNLVKIIRASALGGLAWDKSFTNNWTTASLNFLLNGAYYNATDGTNSGYCIGNAARATIISNCNYTKKGIQAGYRGMIANVTWYLGGYSSIKTTTDAFYGYERGTMVYSGRPTSTTGYIGLMYPSDYGYSVLSSSCARTTNLDSYGTSTCAGASWLYGQGYEWLLTPFSTESAFVFFFSDSGDLNYDYTVYGYNSFRPVIYLNASVYKIDGDGSLNSPYIIGM